MMNNASYLTGTTDIPMSFWFKLPCVVHRVLYCEDWIPTNNVRCL